MAGDCFQVNSRLAEELGGALCHGIVIGQAPIEGVPHVHAWVECEDEELGVVLVHDNSNGTRRVFPVLTYYMAGQIEPKKVARYTVQEMYRRFNKHEHYGPWAEHLVGHL